MVPNGQFASQERTNWTFTFSQKLGFSPGEIKKESNHYSEKRRTSCSGECKVRVGVFNFDKFKLSIQDKVNKELSGLDEQKVSLEYMNRIKEKVDNADGIVSFTRKLRMN